MQTMADAAAALSERVQARHPEINWRGLRGFRNIVAHGYLIELNLDIVWQLLVNELDQLAAMAAAELKSIS